MTTNQQTFEKDFIKQEKREKIYRVLIISSMFSFIIFYINFFMIWGIYNMFSNMAFVYNVGIWLYLLFIPLMVIGVICVLLLEGLLYYSILFAKVRK